MFDVKGKTILVSRGGSGIGYTTAGELSQNGAKVYIASRKRNSFARSRRYLVESHNFLWGVIREQASESLNGQDPTRRDYIVANLGVSGLPYLCDARRLTTRTGCDALCDYFKKRGAESAYFRKYQQGQLGGYHGGCPVSTPSPSLSV